MTTASAPAPALLISFVGLVHAILWRGRLRWLGALAGLAVFLWPRPPSPIAWLGPDGANAAVVEAGQIVAMRPEKRRFAVESFAQHRGLKPPAEEATDRFDCKRDYCIDTQEATPKLAVWFTRRRPSADTLAILCQSDILLLAAPVDVPADCRRALVLRPETFRQFGAAEVVGVADGWRLNWTATERGDRPWSQPQASVRNAERPTSVSDNGG